MDTNDILDVIESLNEAIFDERKGMDYYPYEFLVRGWDDVNVYFMGIGIDIDISLSKEEFRDYLISMGEEILKDLNYKMSVF